MEGIEALWDTALLAARLLAPPLLAVGCPPCSGTSSASFLVLFSECLYLYPLSLCVVIAFILCIGIGLGLIIGPAIDLAFLCRRGWERFVRRAQRYLQPPAPRRASRVPRPSSLPPPPAHVCAASA